MIKKILTLFTTFVLCVAATYMDNEQKYFFASDALIEALQNNVTDEQKRVEAATKYSELMNQQTGMVSIDNLFAVCRAAGFNTYRKEGFDSCKQFINALIELDEDALSGFCPGLDANGNNPNGLKSITNQTRIGDVCSSTNIYAGEVVFKKGYNCTCMAYACNEGYEFKGGACVTMIADGQGFCLRSDNKIQKDMKLEEAKAFCEDLANKNKCKFKSAVILHKELRILCNATRDEVDHAKHLMFESKEKQKANMKYYEVCDDDKGKSGGKEYCVKGVFNWVNVGQKEAVGLAQEYAKVKNGHNVICAEGYRTSWNDDYIKCATGDKKFFYEFQFDDVVESVDADTSNGVVMGLEAIYGKMSGCSDQKIITPAKKYGLQLITRGNNCYFGFKNVKEDELATIEGLDNRVFYDDIQIKGSQQIEEYLKKYIRGKNITITSFSCDNGYKKMDKALMMGIKETDDVLRCVLNNKPIDFVFDDMSELSTERSEAGHAGINCKISGGKYAGKRCHGLSKQQCDDMDAQLKRINPKSAGTIWQDEQCILVDVRQQNYIENGIQIGLSVISLADCATTIVGNAQGVMGCTLAVVEITGLATELTTGNAMQNRAQEFIAQSMKCKEHACALTTIRDLAPKVVSIQDALKSASTAKAVDEELARLIDLLEPEDLKSECKGDCNYQDLISALGGDPSDVSGTALKVANKVGFVAQFASLAGSAFRLTSKAIAKLGAKAAKTADAAGDVARAVSNTARAANAADDVSDATKAVVVAAANATDDVSDATKAASKAEDVVDAVWDATAKRFRDPKTGRFVSGYTKWTDELAEIGVKESVVNGKKVYTDVKTGAALSETQVLNKIPTSMNDDFAKIGVRQIEQADGSIRYLDIRPGGGNKFISEAEVLKRIDDMPSAAVKAADNTADVARTGNKAADVAQTATVAANKADDAIDAAAITRKLNSDFNFDGMIRDVKNGSRKSLSIPKESLTEAQWKVLQESLRKEGLEMMDVPGNASSYGMEQVMIAKRGTQVDGMVLGSANVASKTNNTADAAKVVSKTDDVSALRRTASANFDTYLAEAKNSVTGKSPHKIPKSRLNDVGWLEVNRSLASENVQLVDAGDGYMQFVRADHLDDVADASRVADKAVDVTRSAKIQAARQADNLGFHGTDADIAMTDKIRPSGNTSNQLGSVGYGIAKNYDDAEKYAIRRLIERQNSGKFINFKVRNGVLEITAGEPLNLSNKTGYVYTTAKESSIPWEGLRFSHSPDIASPAAKMPNAVEILDKTTFNLDDLIRSGKIKINIIH